MLNDRAEDAESQNEAFLDEILAVLRKGTAGECREADMKSEDLLERLRPIAAQKKLQSKRAKSAGGWE